VNIFPDQRLRCLLISPAFSSFSFWNYKEVARLIDARAPSPPLGLLTVAALLPQNWQFRLLDLNVRPFCEEDWAWADMICVGGMLPQQKGMLQIIRKARKDGKYVAVGGPDPSIQPDLYAEANAVVVGEGESAIPVWLAAWRSGRHDGVFEETGKPDLTQSPNPLFHLADITEYVEIGVQYSRGCPFNCEFCDIIELFGRKVRTKRPEQLIAELQTIRNLGFTGIVNIVDDNFIGHVKEVKSRLLPALIAWQKKHRYPFGFGTEASMNLADDPELLQLMAAANFEWVFLGIETPDPKVLCRAQKPLNTLRPIVERVQTLYRHGIMVSAGFIMGFDHEPSGMDLPIIRLIEDCGINMAMVGFLVALPKTQLSRRLLKEGRLLSFQLDRLVEGDSIKIDEELVDQTVSGLNFLPTRPHKEIYREFLHVVTAVYEPRAYFDRVLRTAGRLRKKPLHRPGAFELKRYILGLGRLCVKMSQNPRTRWLFCRNLVLCLFKGIGGYIQCLSLMSAYLHYEKQVQYLQSAIGKKIRDSHPVEVAKTNLSKKALQMIRENDAAS
jgi:radical SAM superfamily enzyme YgiQ (UPF0313 family)